MTGLPRAGDSGFTLIESLVTVVIVGIAFTVFVGGMGTAILGSDHHRKQALGQATIRNVAEAVKAVAYDANCATAKSSYAAALADTTSSIAPGPSYATQVLKVQYWTGSGFDPACSDRGLQLISLKVASSDGRDAEIVDVVKRRP